MTRTAGFNLYRAPCCGAACSRPRYLSMNFSAWEYWTDGWRDDSLMPNDEGLRRCACGNFYLEAELEHTGFAEQTDLPDAQEVRPEQLSTAVAHARTPAIALAARLMLWRELNHPYRQRYRAHRDAEEAHTRAHWEAEHPDRRTWWQRFRGVPAPSYTPSRDRPFTYPPYEASHEQAENMRALLPLLDELGVPKWEPTLKAELHRELGQFDRAQEALQQLTHEDQGVTSRLIARLVHERQTAPMRYRM